MPYLGVQTRVVANAIKTAIRFPTLRVRQGGATGPSTPLPDGGLVTYEAGIVTFDPLAPRNALDGQTIRVAGISELGNPYFQLDGVPDDLAADLSIVQLTTGPALAFTPAEA